jgi:hypothetical protein
MRAVAERHITRVPADDFVGDTTVVTDVRDDRRGERRDSPDHGR